MNRTPAIELTFDPEALFQHQKAHAPRSDWAQRDAQHHGYPVQEAYEADAFHVDRGMIAEPVPINAELQRHALFCQNRIPYETHIANRGAWKRANGTAGRRVDIAAMNNHNPEALRTGVERDYLHDPAYGGGHAAELVDISSLLDKPKKHKTR